MTDPIDRKQLRARINERFSKSLEMLSDDPIGTAQERELIDYLCRSTASPEEEQAADALQSRIAEVERLRGALRSVLEWWPEGSETGRASEKYGSGFSKDIANARAALSQL